jgi:hypothetical protein
MRWKEYLALVSGVTHFMKNDVKTVMTRAT